MDERRLTLILIPHGEVETRTYEIGYGKLRLLLGAAGILLVVFVVVASSWWFVAAQAARVPGLEREVVRLEQERAKVAELARTLAEVEAQYERVRQLLGADAAQADGKEPALPPLRPRASEHVGATSQAGRSPRGLARMALRSDLSPAGSPDQGAAAPLSLVRKPEP